MLISAANFPHKSWSLAGVAVSSCCFKRRSDGSNGGNGGNGTRWRSWIKRLALKQRKPHLSHTKYTVASLLDLDSDEDEEPNNESVGECLGFLQRHGLMSRREREEVTRLIGEGMVAWVRAAGRAQQMTGGVARRGFGPDQQCTAGGERV